MTMGRVLRGAVRTQVATGVEWRACVKTVEARAAEFEALFTAHAEGDSSSVNSRKGDLVEREGEASRCDRQKAKLVLD